MKLCSKCGEVKQVYEFCAMAKSKDGRHCWCRSCRSSYNRKWARDRPAYYQNNSRKMRSMYPQRQRARSMVTQEIKIGRIPPARDLACVDCSVRVQRLQDISEHDARDEGVEELDGEIDDIDIRRMAKTIGDMAENSRTWFACLWDSINGKRAPWSNNPWVWAIEFTMVDGGDQ